MARKNRNSRQRQLNTKFSVLPTFLPFTDCQIYLVNHLTSPMLLQDLIQLAKQTTRFTIDTEYDYVTHQPALLQIQFIHVQSIVLLFEACHLPHSSSPLFWLISALLKIIFEPTNVLVSWGNLFIELPPFADCRLLSHQLIDHMTTINVQGEFKQWYNEHFPHTCGLPALHTDSPLCTCEHRPMKHINNQWSLQGAIAYTFSEFLDKSLTKSNWSRSLGCYSNFYQYSLMVNQEPKERHERLVLYAVNDCLAVTKLMMTLNIE